MTFILTFPASILMFRILRDSGLTQIHVNTANQMRKEMGISKLDAIVLSKDEVLATMSSKFDDANANVRTSSRKRTSVPEIITNVEDFPGAEPPKSKGRVPRKQISRKALALQKKGDPTEMLKDYSIDMRVGQRQEAFKSASSEAAAKQKEKKLTALKEKQAKQEAKKKKKNRSKEKYPESCIQTTYQTGGRQSSKEQKFYSLAHPCS